MVLQKHKGIICNNHCNAQAQNLPARPTGQEHEQEPERKWTLLLSALIRREFEL